MLSNSIARLKEKGHRISRGRKAILEVFHNTQKPLTAVEILDLLVANNVHVNKTTVYRELAFLTEESILREVPVSSSIVYYESALQDHHHHIVCKTCNAITAINTDILEKDLERLASNVRKDNGFMIHDHTLEFFGMCHNCQNAS